MAQYVTPKKATQALGVNERTLRRWAEDGKIQFIKTPSGQRRYNIEGYTTQFISNRVDVIYARVSSRAQKPDLRRQVTALSSKYPEAEIISEIGGGLNFKRPKMLALLGRIMSGTVKRLIVAHKDRLARFGFDLFRWLCEQNGCELVVLNETALSPEQEMVEDLLHRLCQHLDNLMSRISHNTGRKRQSMRKAAPKMRNKIRNLIDEAHRQIAHYLTMNYQVIFLPTFETSQMVAKSKRKIRSKTARQMLGWAHYRFSQRLANQAELTNTRLIEGSEAYTSKTCTKCGKIHNTLGGSKVFKCPSCGQKLPRDWNGALGYMLRALRDTSFTVSNDGVAIAALSSNYLYCVA